MLLIHVISHDRISCFGEKKSPSSLCLGKVIWHFKFRSTHDFSFAFFIKNCCIYLHDLSLISATFFSAMRERKQQLNAMEEKILDAVVTRDWKTKHMQWLLGGKTFKRMSQRRDGFIVPIGYERRVSSLQRNGETLEKGIWFPAPDPFPIFLLLVLQFPLERTQRLYPNRQKIRRRGVETQGWNAGRNASLSKTVFFSAKQQAQPTADSYKILFSGLNLN